MSEGVVGFIMVGLIALAVVSFQIVNWMSRRRWKGHEEHSFLHTEFGLDRISDRFLFDTRIQRYHLKRGTETVEVESGAGPLGVYLRVDIHFERQIALGLRVSSEHEDGMMTRVMRLREVEVGFDEFDSQFILLSRDQERLTELLTDEIRAQLSDLRHRVRDLRLNDDGLHLQMFGEVDATRFGELLNDGVALIDMVFQRCEVMREEREALAAGAFAPVVTQSGVTQSAPVVAVEEGA